MVIILFFFAGMLVINTIVWFGLISAMLSVLGGLTTFTVADNANVAAVTILAIILTFVWPLVEVELTLSGSPFARRSVRYGRRRR